MSQRGGVAEAYSATAAAWQRGPGRIYDCLADVVVAECPVPLVGRRVLDLGAGTGAASRAIGRAGGRALAVDAAAGMLGFDRGGRPPAAVGDARALPFASGCFGAVVAAFCLNHLTDPVAGLAEAARVTEPGGAVVASSYADDDDHPVKAAVEAAARELGWSAPPWYEELKAEAMPRLSRPDLVAEAANEAGLSGATIIRRWVAFSELGPADLVRWRLGMAQLAPFAAALGPAPAERLERRALELLGLEPPPLRRSILVLTAVVG